MMEGSRDQLLYRRKIRHTISGELLILRRKSPLRSRCPPHQSLDS
jgi:hypothetical protein